jgi:hypothetical protein
MLKYISGSFRILLPILLLFVVLVLSACGGAPSQTQGVPATGETAIPTQENPVAPETNPVGDIPDSQVFVNYVASPGNYSLDVPEGWARTNNGSDVSFVDKFDGVSVSITQAASAPTADSTQKNEIAALKAAGHAFEVGKVTEMDLPGGHAVKIASTVNSEPDSVTGKQVRLEEDIYIFFQNGTEAMLKLWAPQGADNVDQWKRISESFQWK